MIARLKILEAGPQCSVQDAGRPGLMRFGVPLSGPLDRSAFETAQAALGNDLDLPALEISMGGLTLGCEAGAVTVAVAGGAFRLRHGERRLEGWTVLPLTAGERLTIRAGDRGAWCILAFAGRLRCPRWLGSAATHAVSGFGGGRLQAGQELVVEEAQLRPERHGPIPAGPPPEPVLRVVIGPQERFFAAETVEALLSQPFRVTAAQDRMGLRLTGPSLKPQAALDMPSEAILRGSVQVAGDGVATVLLADHQTTGGYPRIATVLPADLDALVQQRPGADVRFRAVEPEEAVRIARAVHEARKARLAELTEPAGDLQRRLLGMNLIGGAISATDP